jgi:hypothetical protein
MAHIKSEKDLITLCGEVIYPQRSNYFNEFSSAEQFNYYINGICKKCLKINIQHIICRMKVIMKNFNL